GAPRDDTGFGNHATKSPAQRSQASLIGDGLVFDGKEALAVPASPSIKFSAATGFTFSAWIKPAGADAGTLYSQKDGTRSITLSGASGTLAASMPGAKGALKVSGGQLLPGVWNHVALVGGKRVALYLNGDEVAAADGELAELAGEIAIGEGFAGEMDEV